MREGTKVEVLVGVNGGARWVPGRVTRVSQWSRQVLGVGYRDAERVDVLRTDTGTLLLGCHVATSVRVVVTDGEKQ